MVCLFIGKVNPGAFYGANRLLPDTGVNVCGEVKSVEEIMATVLRDKRFTIAAAAA